MAVHAASSLVAQAVPFVHPGIAGAAVLAALVPLIIHLISRRQYRRVPWAAMSFLLAATKRTARRLRFEHLLLLLCRTAIVLLFGLALARPFVSAPSAARATGASGHRILLIDNSLSMSAMRGNGESRFAAARDYTLALLDDFAAGDAVSIVSLAAPAERLLTHPSHDRRLARERLLSLQATHRATDFAGAVAEAAELMREWQGPPGAQTLYLISDFSLRGAEAEGSTPMTAEDEGEAQDVAELLARELVGKVRELILVGADGEHRQNAGVASLSFGQPVVVRGTAESLSVNVVNYGPGELAGGSLQILDRGEVIRKEELPTLSAGRAHQTRVSASFAAPGIHLIEARLIGGGEEALQADDVRYLSVEVVHAIRALLVDGSAGGKPPEGDAGYLALALSPASRIEASESDRIVEDIIESKVIAAPDFAGASLHGVDAIALCNVEQLAGEDWERLRAYVVDGGGVIFFLGGQVDPETYNALGFAERGGILPGRLMSAQGGSGEDAEPLRFSADNLRHPILHELVNNPSSGLFSARIERYFPVEAASDAEVLLRYSNGAAAMLGKSIGRGRVLLYTTTANMDWNTLPAKGDYVSLVRAAFAYTAKPRGAGRNLLVGQHMRERLTAAEVQLPYQAVGPASEVLTPAIAQDADGLALTLPAPALAGVYELSIGESVRPFAVNVDAGECDLSVQSAASLCAKVGNTCRATSVDSAPETDEAAPAVELGAMSLLLVCGLLLTELWLASRFGFRRGGGAS
jgi:hypothetical protein